MKRLRVLVLALSIPLVLVVVLGGLRGSASEAQGAFPHLRVFEDVISLIMSSYVEEVQVDEVMEGALRGLADGLDGDSAYLTPGDVKLIEANAAPEPADIGLALTRQYYLRVVAVRDGSPAFKAGIRSGDYVRGIDGQPTREMSIVEGSRRLRGAPGSTVMVTVIRGNTADPHEFTLTREAPPTAGIVSARMLAEGPGYIRVSSFTGTAVADLKAAAQRLQSDGAASIIIDVRNTAEGAISAGIDAARAFVASGPLATRGTRGDTRETIDAKPGDAVITAPIVVLVSNGTARAGEVFAAALQGAGAELVGEPTQGSAGEQHLVKLPEGRGLWLTWAQYLTRAGEPIHEKGLKPDVAVDEPNFEFDEVPPAGDKMLDAAIERAKARKAA
jgi:carboxyl-terminal processing protease